MSFTILALSSAVTAVRHNNEDQKTPSETAMGILRLSFHQLCFQTKHVLVFFVVSFVVSSFVCLFTISCQRGDIHFVCSFEHSVLFCRQTIQLVELMSNPRVKHAPDSCRTVSFQTEFSESCFVAWACEPSLTVTCRGNISGLQLVRELASRSVLPVRVISTPDNLKRVSDPDVVHHFPCTKPHFFAYTKPSSPRLRLIYPSFKILV